MLQKCCPEGFVASISLWFGCDPEEEKDDLVWGVIEILLSNMNVHHTSTNSIIIVNTVGYGTQALLLNTAN